MKRACLFLSRQQLLTCVRVCVCLCVFVFVCLLVCVCVCECSRALVPLRPLSKKPTRRQHKKLDTLLDLCVSSLRRGHANLLCIVPILTDDLRRGSTQASRCDCLLCMPPNKTNTYFVVVGALTGVVLQFIHTNACLGETANGCYLSLGSIVPSSMLNRAFRSAACCRGKHSWHAAPRFCCCMATAGNKLSSSRNTEISSNRHPLNLPG